MSDILDAREAAEYLKINEQTVRRLARNGDVPAFKVGGSWRFKKDALDRWADGQQSPALSGSAGHILVVDDEEMMRDFVRGALEKNGYRVTTAADGYEALQALDRATADLVFLDLKMPNLSGPDTLRMIRERHNDVPVVILTGYPDGDMVTEALEYSPITLLSKPCSVNQIIASARMNVRPSVGHSSR